MKVKKWVVCLAALCLTSGHFGVTVKYAVTSLPEGGWKQQFKM